jgi:hypothetical protein
MRPNRNFMAAMLANACRAYGTFVGNGATRHSAAGLSYGASAAGFVVGRKGHSAAMVVRLDRETLINSQYRTANRLRTSRMRVRQAQIGRRSISGRYSRRSGARARTPVPPSS